MAETIETAKTGRARCRGCRQPIEKGSLRFGEEQPSAFAEGMQWAWYHLPCAAKQKPVPMKAALAAFEGEVPDRAALEAAMAEADTSASVYPYAERAPTARSRCLHCREPIEKGALRIATERELEAMGRPGTGYLHPRCAREYLELPDLPAALRTNSRGLADADLQEIERELAG
jgi:Poly(ADP-ribose) polymerase and DNA-Ligase Zn-finger region